MIFEGIYRRFTGLKAGRGNIDARFTHQESLAMAQVEPDGFEMSRAGRRFVLGYSAAVTGIAPVQALPTTAAQWVIWNADLAKALVFESLGVTNVSGTAGAGILLLGALITAPAQLGSSAAGLSISSASNGALTSKAIVKSAVTVTSPIAPNWTVLAKDDSTNTAVLAVAAENRDLRGRIIIPPGQGLGLCVLSPAGTTPLYAPYGSWIEVETDLE